jgi:hypothetical protein
MLLLIDTRAGVRCLYTEELPLASLGTLSIRRASHVEPEDDGWYADLSPLHGPKLGPFAKRSQALHAEEAWIEASGLVVPDVGA